MNGMRFLIFAVACFTISVNVSHAQGQRRVGVAAVDITPDYPIRLNGFGHRRSESEGVTQKIWAKAMAIEDGGDAASRAVLLTVDSLGVPDYMTREVATRLKDKARLDPARLAISSSHTHTAPMLKDCCPTIFGMPIAPAEQERIDRYTRELTDYLEKVAVDAIADLKPGRLEYGIGAVGFAVNRRPQGGPVDHDLPLMVVKDQAGKLRAIFVSYACHCVTLADNKISGDWAGYAQEILQKEHPGVVALTGIGCGADSNPSQRNSVEIAAGQGAKIAEEVGRLLQAPLTPLDGPITTTLNRIDLPFDVHPTREQWEETAKRQDASGHHARVNLAKLDRGEKLQTELSYPIQTWAFGDQLAMVFLPGEVVVDYAVRLKTEFDRNRIWINAYANDVPCYIPSERILKEGGYEGAGAMIYYDRPARLATGVEQKIVDEVHRQVPGSFVAPKGTEGVSPRSPEQSLRAIRVKPGFEVELVASEPLITSPVAIDWGPDGRLWVCEMYDYPTGADQNWQPGGRVRVLADTDGDGRYDKADVFLDKLPFPTGVTAWGRGAFVCAAPDILYAEDSNGDGKADFAEKRFSGFATDNYQARVNSLSLGLDNWVHGANGLLGGVILYGKDKLDIRGRDFRFRAPGGPMEPVAGLTQQGRARDDFGRWFGCDNSNALFHYPHDERYYRRNPQASSPPMVVNPRGEFDVSRVYPISRTLERFNHPESVNHVTSACGLGVYRDTLLGEPYLGNTFTCEPVHNVVHRLILDGDGPSLTRRRAEDEAESEFFASADNWCRPVQARTGPDGALYVVDMYRFLIEHPRWIPAERLTQLDARAGSDMGRIYRIRPANGAQLRAVRDLTKLDGAQLAAAMDSPNGAERDRVHVELLHRRGDRAAAAAAAAAATPALEKLAAEAPLPQVRLQAMCALDGLGALTAVQVARALEDRDERVRRKAVQFSEAMLRQNDVVIEAQLLRLVDDASPVVRTQLALTLGEWPDPRAGVALAALAKRSLDDGGIRAAVLRSAARHCGPVLAAVMSAPSSTGRDAWIAPLVATAAATPDDKLLAAALAAVLPAGDAEPTAAHFAAIAGLFDALERRRFASGDIPALRDAAPRVARVILAARKLAADDAAPAAPRVEAIRLIGRRNAAAEDLDVLCRLAVEAPDAAVRAAALAAVRGQQKAVVADRMLSRWQQTSPAAREQVIGLLLGREEWTAALLEAVKKGTVQPQELSLTDRQRLSESPSESIRKLAAAIVPPAAAALGARAEALRQYESVAALTGNPAAGVELFSRNCASCHALGGLGHDVGPDLTALAGKDADYFVKNIIDPNAIVEPRFVNYTLVLRDKRSTAGVIKSETATNLMLAVGAGVTETVPRSDIVDIRASKVSMMPEGFEAGITPQQMADLIAYLKTAGPARKQVPGNAPAVVTQSPQGPLILPATAAEIFGGGQITLESEFRNIGYWHGQGDYVAWNAQIEKPGEFDVYLDYACEQRSAGNGYTIGFGPAGSISGTVTATGPDWSNYQQAKVGTIRLSAGRQRIEMRPSGPLRGALIDLRAIALVPAGAKVKFGGAATAQRSAAPAAPAGDGVMRDAPSVARFIIDKSNSTAAREAAINANPQFAPELIAEMTRDLAPGPGEYERIPWIWRVAIAAGKRNDAGKLRRMLDVSLPQADQPLRDWQAVVIGGGIINGLTQGGAWPAERIAEIIGDDQKLKDRYQRALDLSSVMTDDEKVPTGTRYDALRMLGVEPFDRRGEQLVRYLGKDVHAELQMGAVSGLGDVRDPRAARALIGALPGLTEGNRKLALQALVRNDERIAALRDAVRAGTIDHALLDSAAKERLAH